MREDWIPVGDAPERVRRSLATIYRWLDDPNLAIRTMRPGRRLWVNLPDLLRAESKMRPGRPRHAEAGGRT